MSPPLPSTVAFVDRLIQRLSQFNFDFSLSSLSSSNFSIVKQSLLTLHCLFPNELLLALDILDRKLIRRFVVIDDGYHDDSSTNVPLPPPPPPPQQQQQHQHQHQHQHPESFFVISSSSRGSPPTISTSSREHQNAYQINLLAWNCSCPSFTLSTFLHPHHHQSDQSHQTTLDNPASSFSSCPSSSNVASSSSVSIPIPVLFGGSLTQLPSSSSTSSLPVPVCKHLLACILAVRCPELFGSGIEHRFVSAAELAGWCAG